MCPFMEEGHLGGTKVPKMDDPLQKRRAKDAFLSGQSAEEQPKRLQNEIPMGLLTMQSHRICDPIVIDSAAHFNNFNWEKHNDDAVNSFPDLCSLLAQQFISDI
ncbi:hypothetical protein niasHT_024388 [Heterodera trifolii]|uniref:Uncharacterized protein n=1 Tax=Heterodera trifolii TaxID=157864 RepID=A0ABD2JY80_9BILA